jgi:hypothetical protein
MHNQDLVQVVSASDDANLMGLMAMISSVREEANAIRVGGLAAPDPAVPL